MEIAVPLFDFAEPTSRVTLGTELFHTVEYVMDSRIRLLLVDDEARVRQGLRMCMAGEPDFEVIGEADEGEARFSPDGRWIAYASNETGRSEVYVQAFPPTGGKWQVSLEGATEPTWARGGRELLYLGLDGMLNAVDALGDAESFRTGAVRPLFRAGPPATPGGSRYDVTADGERFLVQVPLPLPPEPLMVLVNWLEALDQRN